MERVVIRAGVVGGSGYAGGELVRLLLGHPQVELQYVTSTRHAGEFVYQTHPNLRKHTRLKFTSADRLEPTEVLFLALPHGEAQQGIDRFARLAPRLVDLSADFRLRSAEEYRRWYGSEHAAPEWLGKFGYGLPELTRADLGGANYVSGVGCNAAASILCLLPLVRADLLDRSQPIVIEIKVGSSEGGAEGNPGSHHPERSGVIRTFSTFGHRHTAEVIQAFGLPDVSLTMTSVDLVRGVLATAHARTRPGITSQDLWRAYRELADENLFLRVVREARGIYRVPEPKILAGSNYADVGFDLDESTGHVISICALDNLMKGAAGSAVQCLNLMLGWDETLGLSFPGLHPI
jgi:N-acetyl-gamma-glutamyl-phosphate/LysW-gamma-L-alpha-aminoadipyl-6-phosphate reductase